MRGALVFIGDELLSGEVSNLNAEVAIGELTGNGFEVGEVLAIPDQIEVIASHLRRIVEEYQFLICSGGLGPTDDDLTNQAVSKALGLPLEKNKEFSQAISSSPAFAKVQELAQKMALLPKGAVPLSKDLSCAGYYLLVSEKLLFFLPGVPHQFNQLLKEEVIPLLLKKFGEASKKYTLVFRFFDLEEAELNRFLRNFEFKGKAGYYPEFPELRLVLRLIEKKEGLKISEAIKKAFSLQLIGDKSLPEVLGKMLVEKGLILSVAESCTGGLVSSLITSIPGSSEYFERGLVTYSPESKVELLGVRESTIKKSGVVSFETALEMAEGVRKACKTDIGIGITGFAGPGGGTPSNPVGTVYIGISYEDLTCAVRFQFPGCRRDVQLLAGYTALDMVRRCLIYGSESLSRYRFAKGVKSKA